MDPETQDLNGASDILAAGGDTISLTRGGYPFFRSDDAVKQAVNPNDMTADFVIVTRGKGSNRNGCMVQITPGDAGGGILLDSFNKNPVVLLNHGEDFALPLGVSSVPVLAEKKATATVRFSQRLPEAAQVFALIDEGVLRTSSISYLPLKARMQSLKRKKSDDDAEMDFTGDRCIDFTESDLLEWSIVTIPADPGAVRRFLELGKIREEKITQAIRQSLAPQAEEAKAWSGWTKERDSLLERISKLEQGNVKAKVEEFAKECEAYDRREQDKKPTSLSAKAAPVPLSKIIADAMAPHVVGLTQRLEKSERLIPRR